MAKSYQSAEEILRELLDDGPGIVGGAIVDEDDFIGEAMLIHHAANPRLEFRQRLGFIQQGYNNGYIHDYLISVFPPI